MKKLPDVLRRDRLGRLMSLQHIENPFRTLTEHSPALFNPSVFQGVEINGIQRGRIWSLHMPRHNAIRWERPNQFIYGNHTLEPKVNVRSVIIGGCRHATVSIMKKERIPTQHFLVLQVRNDFPNVGSQEIHILSPPIRLFYSGSKDKGFHDAVEIRIVHRI